MRTTRFAGNGLLGLALCAIVCAGRAGQAANAQTGDTAAAGSPPGPTGDWVWVKMEEPKGLPLLGNGNAAVFDTAIKRMILFGGHLGNSGPQRFYTWLYDPQANQWQDAKPANRPLGSCCIREGVHDPALAVASYRGGHRE